MTIPSVHEDDVEALRLPGRRLRWLVAKDAVAASNCSACVILWRPARR